MLVTCMLCNARFEADPRDWRTLLAHDDEHRDEDRSEASD
jgi:hypothetical protein